jgi:CheY-like chemotaxis protein
MSRRTLLHIDDNKDDIFLFKKACLENGVAFNLQHVTGGKEALRYLQGVDLYADRSRFPLPHLVLLDLKMPPPDGFAILRWIREQADFSNLTICIFTSSFQYEDIRKAYELGANCFLTKSASFEKLLVLAAAVSQAIAQLPPQLDFLKQLQEFRQ